MACCAAVGVAAFAAHGLLLLNDGVYWDGWILYLYHLNGELDALYDLFRLSGQPLKFAPHAAMHAFSDVVAAYKATTFLSLLVSALFLFAFARTFIGAYGALFVSLVFVTFPACLAYVELTIMPSALALALFSVAAYLSLASEARGGPAHALLRAAALALFYVSFIFLLLPVIYGAVLALLYVNACARKGVARGSLREFFLFLRARPDYVLLPLIFYASHTIFLRSAQLGNETYYVPQLLNPQLPMNAIRFLANGIVLPMGSAAMQLSDPRLLAVAVALAVGLSWMLRHWSVERLAPKPLFLFGGLLLALVAAPYVVTGKYPSPFSVYSTRHAILIGLPVGILALGASVFAARKAPDVGRWLVAATLAALLVGSSASLADGYLRLQARWAVDVAVMGLLRENPHAERCSTFWIDHRVRLLGDEASIDFYEWSSMFRRIWGGESRIGFETRGYSYDQATRISVLRQHSQWFRAQPKYYNLSSYSGGVECNLTVKAGPALARLSASGLGAEYLRLRFADPQGLPMLLSALVEIELQTLGDLGQLFSRP